MTSFSFGLGWDSKCDIDASMLLLNSDKELEDVVYFGNKDYKPDGYTSAGAVKHSGDNLTGEGDGDDEVIQVNLNK